MIAAAAAQIPQEFFKEAFVPDVHFWHSQSLFQDTPEYQTKKKLQRIVAEHMDCFDDEGNWIKHDPGTQIDIRRALDC